MKYPIKTYGKDANGEFGEVDLAIIPPSAKVHQDAQVYRGKVYAQALAGGMLIKQQLDDHLRDRGLWSDAKEAEFQRLRRAILDGEVKLKKLGITRKAARDLALQMSRDRAAVNRLLMARSEIEAHTADALAEQARVNYLVAACTVYNSGPRQGQPYFGEPGSGRPSVEQFIERGGEVAAQDAAAKMEELVNGSMRDVLRRLPETAFLLEHKMMDEDFNLVDEKGRRVDESGRLIDENGFYIDEAGNRVDEFGNPVDENGEFAVECLGFVDEDVPSPIEDAPPATHDEIPASAANEAD